MQLVQATRHTVPTVQFWEKLNINEREIKWKIKDENCNFDEKKKSLLICMQYWTHQHKKTAPE